MAELLAALAARPGEWFTTDEAAGLTTTTCSAWVHSTEESRRYGYQRARHRACWVCKGQRTRPRMGWEARRFLTHLLRDGMVLIDPASSPCGSHRWSADLEAIALEEHWQELAEAAG